VVLLILAVLWGFVLVPPLLRNRAATRTESKRIRSLRRFRRRLARLSSLTPPLPARRHADASRPAGAARPHVAIIARPGPVATPQTPEPPAAPRERERVPVPVARQTVLRRRRQQLVLLLAAMASTLVLGVLPPLRSLWTVHLLLDAVCAGYTVWLRRTHRARLTGRDKVRYLPTAAAVYMRGREHVELRRSATSS
jgi:hypothetical protein